MVVWASLFILFITPKVCALSQNVDPVQVWRLALSFPASKISEQTALISLHQKGGKIAGHIDYVRSQGTVTGWFRQGAMNMGVSSPDGPIELEGRLDQGRIAGVATRKSGAIIGTFIMTSENKVSNIATNINVSGNKSAPIVQSGDWSFKWDDGLNKVDAKNYWKNPEPFIGFTTSGSKISGTARYTVGWCFTPPPKMTIVNVDGNWTANNHLHLELQNLYSIDGVFDPATRIIKGTQNGTGRAFTMTP